MITMKEKNKNTKKNTKKSTKKIQKSKLNSFSVQLGLLDYANPILYSITIITIMCHTPFNILLLIGAIISIFFGLLIPTGKVLVGLKKIKFKMPVSLVFLVNAGILLSGITFLKYAIDLKTYLAIFVFLLTIIFLFLLYKMGKKINTIAVLTGAFGYLMLYTALIAISLKQGLILPIVLYVIAIILFVLLCLIGIKADLKKPLVHWIIEISNVICQLLVAIGTLILFL